MAVTTLMSLCTNPPKNKQKTKEASVKILSIPDNWSLSKGETNGNLMLVRKNNGYNQIAGNKTYPTRCGIALKFLYPNANGLPQIQKEPNLDKLEDDILSIFQSDLNSLVTVIITTSGFREYILYTKDVKIFEKGIEQLKAKYTEYTITSYSQLDESWSTYKSFE